MFCRSPSRFWASQHLLITGSFKVSPMICTRARGEPSGRASGVAARRRLDRRQNQQTPGPQPSGGQRGRNVARLNKHPRAPPSELRAVYLFPVFILSTFPLEGQRSGADVFRLFCSRTGPTCQHQRLRTEEPRGTWAGWMQAASLLWAVRMFRNVH